MHLTTRLANLRSELKLVAIVACTVFSGAIPEAEAVSSAAQDSAAAKSEVETPLKTRIPNASERHAPLYMIELQKSQAITPLSDQPVRAVEQPLLRIDQLANPQTAEHASIGLARPPLKALISVQENLNPFSMDAHYVERIGLEDALKAAIGQNLDIADSLARLRIQKYTYLATASKFLPDAKAGYNLVGAHGSIPTSLFGGGASAQGASTTSKLPSLIQVLNAGFTYNMYQGGKVLFGTLEEKHRLRASRASLKGSVNDVLLSTATRYYDLILNEALLAIRTRAVEISTEQVRMNSAMEKAGTATGLEVLQSQAQLASDQQKFGHSAASQKTIGDSVGRCFEYKLCPRSHIQGRQLG